MPLRLALLGFLLSNFVHAATVEPRGRLHRILQDSADCTSQLQVLEGLPSGLEKAESVKPLVRETKRFELRALTTENFPEVKRVWLNPDVAKMSGDYLDESSVLRILQRGQISPERLEPGAMINFGIYENNNFIGLTQLAATSPERALMKGLANRDETWAEISYHLDPKHWGRGIATEIGREVIALAFDKFGVAGIHGETEMNNHGSGNVLKKLGLSLIDEGRFPSAMGIEGSNYYAMRKPSAEPKVATSPVSPPADGKSPGFERYDVAITQIERGGDPLSQRPFYEEVRDLINSAVPLTPDERYRWLEEAFGRGSPMLGRINYNGSNINFGFSLIQFLRHRDLELVKQVLQAAKTRAISSKTPPPVREPEPVSAPAWEPGSLVAAGKASAERSKQILQGLFGTDSPTEAVTLKLTDGTVLNGKVNVGSAFDGGHIWVEAEGGRLRVVPSVHVDVEGTRALGTGSPAAAGPASAERSTLIPKGLLRWIRPQK